MVHIRSNAALLFALALMVSAPVDVEAQDWFADVAFNQAFTDSDPLRSPGGFAVSAGGIALWGPLGVHATYRQVSDGADDLVEACAAAAACMPGTYGRSYQMRTVGAGISYDFINPTDVMLTLGLTGAKNWQRERLQHLVSRERSTVDLASSYSLSASAHLRLRPLLTGVRPEIGVHLDRYWGGECVVSTGCWQGRNVVGVSVGFGWVLRKGRKD